MRMMASLFARSVLGDAKEPELIGEFLGVAAGGRAVADLSAGAARLEWNSHRAASRVRRQTPSGKTRAHLRGGRRRAGGRGQGIAAAGGRPLDPAGIHGRGFALEQNPPSAGSDIGFDPGRSRFRPCGFSVRGRGGRRARGIERLVDRALPASADPDRGRRAGPPKHHYLFARGYKLVRRTALNNWYVPIGTPFPISPFGRWQLFRKLYLGTWLRRWKRRRKLRRRASAVGQTPAEASRPKVEGDRNAVRAVFRRGERPCLDRLRAAR